MPSAIEAMITSSPPSSSQMTVRRSSPASFPHAGRRSGSLGVWDTVASVIVPRPDRFYTFSLQTLPFTERNPSVQAFRQAIAVDERRAHVQAERIG